jgi:hypothetical protein
MGQSSTSNAISAPCASHPRECSAASRPIYGLNTPQSPSQTWIKSTSPAKINRPIAESRASFPTWITCYRACEGRLPGARTGVRRRKVQSTLEHHWRSSDHCHLVVIQLCNEKWFVPTTRPCSKGGETCLTGLICEGYPDENKIDAATKAARRLDEARPNLQDNTRHAKQIYRYLNV